MKRLLCAVALILTLDGLTGCAGRWYHPSSIQFSANPGLAESLDYETVHVISPLLADAKRDTEEATFVIDSRGRVMLVPPAYRSQLSGFAAGSVLPIPANLVERWQPATALYGEEAGQLLATLPRLPLQEDGTKRLEVSGGPLALNKTTAYIGRECYVQKPHATIRTGGPTSVASN